jgi:hypothetical protein
MRNATVIAGWILGLIFMGGAVVSAGNSRPVGIAFGQAQNSFGNGHLAAFMFGLAMIIVGYLQRIAIGQDALYAAAIFGMKEHKKKTASEETEKFS